MVNGLHYWHTLGERRWPHVKNELLIWTYKKNVFFSICSPCPFSVTLYGVFTNHSCVGVPTHCLLLELLDVSVSELLVRGSTQAIISSTQGGSGRYVLFVQCAVVAVDLN